MGEHKGGALAIVNELLAGVLTGGGTSRPETVHPNRTIINNMLSVIIDPARLVDSDAYAAELDAALAHVQASPPEDPAAPVLAPGEPERIVMRTRMESGVPVDATSWGEIVDAAGTVGVSAARMEELAGGQGDAS